MYCGRMERIHVNYLKIIGSKKRDGILDFTFSAAMFPTIYRLNKNTTLFLEHFPEKRVF